jgi:hypothetical protein
MSVLEHGKRIAELLIQNQNLVEKFKSAYPMPVPVTFELPPTPTPSYVFKELPKSLNSYGYNPHQCVTVPAGERKTVWCFTVSPNHVFHIEQIGTNWYPDTYLLFQVDGNTLEKIERFYGEINAPIDVRRRYIYATHEVRFITVNNSSDDVIYDVLCDGSLYLTEDFFEAAKRGLLV